MIGPRTTTDDGSQIHFWAIVVVTLLVMLLGILVVLYPERMGITGPPATPATQPAAPTAPGP